MTNTKKITENKNHPDMKTNNNERQNKTKLFRLSPFLFLSDGKKMCINKRQCPSRIHSSMKLIDMTKRNLSTLSSFSFLERTKVHRIVICEMHILFTVIFNIFLVIMLSFLLFGTFQEDLM